MDNPDLGTSANLNKIRLELLKNLDNQFQPFYQDISNYVLAVLLKAQDPDRIIKVEDENGDLVNKVIPGVIPSWKIPGILKDIDAYVNRAFLGKNGNAYDISNNGTILPNSQYFQLLLDGLRLSTRLGVAENHIMMVDVLQDQPELKAKLSMGTLNPLTAGDSLPANFSHLGNYDPAHEWIDPSGKTLSDRIWSTAGETRKKLDLYLKEAITSGKTARDMTDDLENFMIPGKALERTDRPYGTDCSYDGMRLARTEIASAQTRASHASAQLNPFVEQYQPMLSRQHPVLDECDDAIALGPYDKDDDSGLPPFHPQCLCRIQWIRAESMPTIIGRLKEDLDSVNDPALIPITPIRLDYFVNMLLGSN